MASNSKNIAELLESDGDVITAALDNIVVTPAAVSDKPNTSTGGLTLPAGTTAQRPGSPDTGESRFNSTTGSLEYYSGSGWVSTNLIPNISSISGTINNTYASNLVFAVTSTTDTVDVVFSEGGSAFHTVTGRSVSSGGFTLATPSQVYGQTAGDTISISIKNSDGTPSGNSITKTVIAAPTGGTITTYGTTRVHTFLSSANFVASSAITADILVVAGAGGGGGTSINSSSGGGGGGAGGMVTFASQSVGTGTHTVTVGAGGAERGGANQRGGQGGDSRFGTLTNILGGGGGGSADSGPHAAFAGGSGGGAGNNGGLGTAGAGTAGQGNNGGEEGDSGPNYPAGGGGGKGAVGGSAVGSATQGGAGGAGAANNYRTNSNVTYAGGGGGSSYNGGAGGAGGAGGGSAGLNGNSGAASNGTANLGGGGGGNSKNQVCGNGGSGIVVIRYAM